MRDFLGLLLRQKENEAREKKKVVERRALRAGTRPASHRKKEKIEMDSVLVPAGRKKEKWKRAEFTLSRAGRKGGEWASKEACLAPVRRRQKKGDGAHTMKSGT